MSGDFIEAAKRFGYKLRQIRRVSSFALELIAFATLTHIREH
jgi:hypothetical protein